MPSSRMSGLGSGPVAGDCKGLAFGIPTQSQRHLKAEGLGQPGSPPEMALHRDVRKAAASSSQIAGTEITRREYPRCFGNS